MESLMPRTTFVSGGNFHLCPRCLHTQISASIWLRTTYLWALAEAEADQKLKIGIWNILPCTPASQCKDWPSRYAPIGSIEARDPSISLPHNFEGLHLHMLCFGVGHSGRFLHHMGGTVVACSQKENMHEESFLQSFSLASSIHTFRSA